MQIINPKRNRRDEIGRASWYPYYAGFSTSFANAIIVSASLPNGAVVLDPWNGSGTTTAASAALGFNAHGFDLNPVMVVAAKARLLSSRERPSLHPIAADIVAKATASARPPLDADDPLLIWFVPGSVAAIRNLERSLYRLLVAVDVPDSCLLRNDVDNLSGLASFFYTALFRAIRRLLKPFSSSNPTWVKAPVSPDERLNPTLEHIACMFIDNVLQMASVMELDDFLIDAPDNRVTISVTTSESLPLHGASVDLVLSSPPYCTRIDYAVATKPELAVLGFRWDTDFQVLRRRMIGTSTVPLTAHGPASAWGACCNTFLRRLAAHDSKASSTYYYKFHLQYFSSIYQSVMEIARILRRTGHCVLVVQDSFYKDIHNDLPTMLVEMGASVGLALVDRADFGARRTMASINRGARRYPKAIRHTESVLSFKRT